MKNWTDTHLEEMTEQERALGGPTPFDKCTEGSSHIDKCGIHWYRIHGKWMKLTTSEVSGPSYPTMNCGDETMYPEGSSYGDIHGEYWKVVNGKWEKDNHDMADQLNKLTKAVKEMKKIQEPPRKKKIIPITKFMEGQS